MCEESPPGTPLSDNDRLLMSADAVAARTKLATAKRLQWRGLSAGDVAEVGAALNHSIENGTASVSDALDAMDMLILDLVLMTLPLGLKHDSIPEIMISLPGWRKK